MNIPKSTVRRLCDTVETITPEIVSLAEDMVDYMDTHRGDGVFPVGLSAPQLGELVRVIAFRRTPTSKEKEDIQVLINPVMVYCKGQHHVNESCDSIPGRTFTLRRHKIVKIRGTTLSGGFRSFRGRDLTAQIFEHELNHLDGILLDKIGVLMKG